MRLMKCAALTVALGFMAVAAEDPDAAKLAASVEQLRHVVGRWEVTTEFLNDDGTAAKAVSGSYLFEWVVPDRVVAGRSDLPELKQVSGILFLSTRRRESSRWPQWGWTAGCGS